jgi:hypothetical protein
MGELRNAYSILVGKHKRKRPLGRYGHKWEDNIRVVLRKIGWGGGWVGVDWMHLAQDRIGISGGPL